MLKVAIYSRIDEKQTKSRNFKGLLPTNEIKTAGMISYNIPLKNSKEYGKNKNKNLISDPKQNQIYNGIFVSSYKSKLKNEIYNTDYKNNNKNFISNKTNFKQNQSINKIRISSDFIDNSEIDSIHNNFKNKNGKKKSQEKSYKEFGNKTLDKLSTNLKKKK